MLPAVTHEQLQFQLYDDFSCTGRCNLEFKSITSVCQCDPVCHVFNDCCFDYPEVCGPSANDTSALSPDVFSCVPLEESHPSYGSYLLVNKCPQNWTRSSYLRRMCEVFPSREIRHSTSSNAQSLFNWHVFDSSGNNYKNVFCAICNGNRLFDLETWNMRAEPNVHAINSTTASACRYEPPYVIDRTVGSRIRPCSFAVVDTCPDSYQNDSLSQVCASYSAQICPGSTIYKNFHCGLCNGLQLLELSDISPCMLYREGHSTYNGGEVPIFRALWHFKEEEDQSLNSDSNASLSCSSKEDIFDPVLRRCVTPSCSPGYVYDSNTSKCNKSALLANAIDGMCCEAQESWVVYTERNGLEDKVTELSNCLERHLNITVDVNDSAWQQQTMAYSTHTKVILTGGHSMCNIGDQLDRAIVDSDDFFENCWKDVIEYMYVCQKAARQQPFDCDGLWYHGQSDDFVFVNFTDLAEVVLYRQEIIVPLLIINYVSYEYDLFNGRYNQNETVLMCGDKIPRLTCPLITLELGEYLMSEDNKLIVNVTSSLNYTIDEGRYILFGDGRAQICSLSVAENTKSKIFNYIGYLDIFNTMGSLLSMIALALILVIHCIFPNLRSSHGRSMMCHCGMMILAQLTSLLSAKFPVSGRCCVGIASLNHGFWLSAFTWMTIIAIDMTFMLIFRPYQRSEDREYKSLYRMLLLGWGVPATIVALCTYLHISGALGFHYGNTSPCWIATPTANLIAFGVPLAACLAINVTCYIASVITTCRSQQQSRVLQGRPTTICFRDLSLSLKVI